MAWKMSRNARKLSTVVWTRLLTWSEARYLKIWYMWLIIDWFHCKSCFQLQNSARPSFSSMVESSAGASSSSGCGCDVKYKQLIVELQQHWINEYKHDREKVMADLTERVRLHKCKFWNILFFHCFIHFFLLSLIFLSKIACVSLFLAEI